MLSAEDVLLLYVRLRQKTVGTKQALSEINQALWNVHHKVGYAPPHKESFIMSSYLTSDPVAKPAGIKK
jgi:hypothetical protein